MNDKEPIENYIETSNVFSHYADALVEMVLEKTRQPDFVDNQTVQLSKIVQSGQSLRQQLFALLIDEAPWDQRLYMDYVAELCVFCYLVEQKIAAKVDQFRQLNAHHIMTASMFRDTLEHKEEFIIYPKFASLLLMANNLCSLLSSLSFCKKNQEMYGLVRIARDEILPILEHRFRVIHIKPGDEQKQARQIRFILESPDLRYFGGSLFAHQAIFMLAQQDRVAAQHALGLSARYFQGESRKTSDMSALARRAEEYWSDKHSAWLKENTPSLRKIYKANRKQWARMMTLAQVKPHDLKKIMMWQYVLLARTYLLDISCHSYAHVECFLDMGYQLWQQFFPEKKLAPGAPTEVGYAFTQLAAELLHVEREGDAVRCYHKASTVLEECASRFEHSLSVAMQGRDGHGYPQDKKQLEEIRAKQVEISTVLKGLDRKLFNELVDAWKSKSVSIPEEVELRFGRKNMRISIHCSDTSYSRLISKHLKRFQIHHQRHSSGLIEVDDLGGLTANRLVKLLHAAKSELETRKREILRKLALQRAMIAESTQQTERGPSVNLLDMSKKQAKSSTKKVRAKLLSQPKVAPVEIVEHRLPRIQWGQTFPEYHSGSDVVFPIPDPTVKNAPMPSGLFFGYIDRGCFDDIDNRYQRVLATGLFSNSDGAQGIRYVRHEDGVPEYYLFKINVGAHDDRLYGYKAASVIVEDVPRVLICFDQAVSHKKTVKPKKEVALAELDNGTLQKNG